MRPLTFKWIAVALLVVSFAPSSEAHGTEPISNEEIREALRGPWTRVRTQHFRVHSDFSSPLDSYQLDSLESSFKRIADGLGLGYDIRQRFREEPIEFYYTRHRGLLERLGGRDAEGLAFPDHRVIVSLRLPHAHEVAHVLLHIASGSRAPKSAPILQEGLATWWGGTAEAATPVILHNACDVIADRRAQLEDLMTPSRLRNSESDSHDLYSLAALFCEYLRQRHSMATLLELHALLSGHAEDLEERPARATIVQFEGLEGLTWPEIVEGFDRWAVDQRFGGVARVSLVDRVADFERIVGAHRIRWWRLGDELMVAMETSDGRPVDAELLWGEIVRPLAGSDRDQPKWRRWGLRVSPDGVLLSDHRARRQLARLAGSTGADEALSQWVVRLDASVVAEVGFPHEVEVFVTPRFESSVAVEPRIDTEGGSPVHGP